MREALIHLGLTAVAAAEVTDNGITTIARLRALTEDALDRLIKQLTRDNHGGTGLVISFNAQQYLHAILFWLNRMYILGLPCEAAMINEALAEEWNERRKAENEAAEVPDDLVKKPEPFKKTQSGVPGKKVLLLTSIPRLVRLASPSPILCVSLTLLFLA